MVLKNPEGFDLSNLQFTNVKNGDLIKYIEIYYLEYI